MAYVTQRKHDQHDETRIPDNEEQTGAARRRSATGASCITVGLDAIIQGIETYQIEIHKYCLSKICCPDEMVAKPHIDGFAIISSTMVIRLTAGRSMC